MGNMEGAVSAVISIGRYFQEPHHHVAEIFDGLQVTSFGFICQSV